MIKESKNKGDYHITHITVTLYENNYYDNLLIKRLYRKNGGKFQEKVFHKNIVEKILQEPDFYKFYKHLKNALGIKTTIKRTNTISFLFIIMNIFKVLKKVTFFVSKRQDTQKKFKDNQQIFSFAYGIKKMKVDLRNAFKANVKMNQEVEIQHMIQDFKKAIRNGFYDKEIMNMMQPQLRLHIHTLHLYHIITAFDEDTFDLFQPCLNYLLNVLNTERILNSNPVMMIE